MDVDLTGRAAVVTGGTAGIGLAVATALTGLGASVLVTYGRDRERADRVVAELGPGASAVEADNGRPGTARLVIDAAVERFGRLDIVVANAGETGRSPVGSTEAGTYDRIFDANVRSVWELLEACVPVLGEGGRVVLLSSVRTIMNTPETGLYAASKAAVEAMVPIVAKELGPRGVTVNAVAPGATDTALLRSVNDQDAIDAMAAVTPLGRVGRPDDIAGLVAYLATPAAGWVTGQVIGATGGLGL
ncbi:MAG: SDR family oxidoreductase [Actinomycetota bacterium]